MLDPAWEKKLHDQEDDDDDNVQKFSPIIQQPFIIPEAVAAKWRARAAATFHWLWISYPIRDGF